ncbi:DUF882 domain-containing protein [Granulicella sp. WH15]|uniref:DUF882 domain-containing protein n=1 Tax=Granulicella sp. WH15 TaxID=2602070 RepID=UPI0013671002|nr:DUF882 domain-containing protein [Granulicella sp. WH15]QHN05165.1 DUF882 domain-containing protein [Granulicella sp. WH15]
MMAAATVATLLIGSGGSTRIARAEETTVAATTSDAEILAGAGARYRLRLHHLHTGEDIDIVYRVGDQYVPGALEALDYFLRDHRTDDASRYDPKEFDVLHSVMEKLHKPNGIIDIVCGYRTPWSNNFLRARSANTGVAEHSQHVLAKAIDIRVPGIQTRTLRDAALSLHEGGVGYYPVSQFVHVDVGPVREWSFGRVARVRRSHRLSRGD